MGDIQVAIILAAILSVLIGFIELQSQSKANLKKCWTSSAAIYIVILLIGNAATTLTAAATTKSFFISDTVSNPASAPSLANAKETAGDANNVVSEKPAYAWFWFAFLGVFGFEALLQKINITFDGKGFLTINDWIAKARNNAVAAAIKAQADAEHERAQLLAKRLRAIPEDELNTHVLTLLGKDATELDNAAKAAGANSILYKALALAYGSPDRASAIQ